MTQWGLDVLFNPAKRHMDEEKQRLQMTREEAGDSSGGKRIDLDSGKVVIQRPASKPHAQTDEAADEARAEADEVEADEAVVEADEAVADAPMTAEDSDPEG